MSSFVNIASGTVQSPVRVQAQDNALTGSNALRAQNSGSTSTGVNVHRHKISDSEISYQLQNLKVPSSKENMTLAKTMIEFQVPFNAKAFMTLKQALAQFLNQGDNDMRSACFLKQNNLPLNRKNITSLSGFMENHPKLGNKLAEFQQDMKKLEQSGLLKEEFSAHLKFLSRIPKLISQLILDPKMMNNKDMLESLMNIARQAGAENTQEGSRKLDFSKIMNFLGNLQGKLSEGMERTLLAKTMDFIKNFSEVFTAMGLINKAEKNESKNYIYCQVPFVLDENTGTGELKITYRTDEEINPANIKLEFSVETEKLGKMYFNVNVLNSIIDCKIETLSEKIRDFMNGSLGQLENSFAKINYQTARLYAVSGAGASRDMEIELKSEVFEEIENVEISC